jgi:hypothetical protein
MNEVRKLSMFPLRSFPNDLESNFSSSSLLNPSVLYSSPFVSFVSFVVEHSLKAVVHVLCDRWDDPFSSRECRYGFRHRQKGPGVSMLSKIVADLIDIFFINLQKN